MLADVDDDLQGTDICRVCRSEATRDRPLFHPCICTGSIKWIHQECLVQWMRYSRKEYCELCRYKFSFTPIYAPNMPRRLPISDIIGGLVGNALTGFKYWLHYSIVALAWLGIVPLVACRIFKGLFSGSLDSMITLPLVMFSTEDIISDILQGSLIVTCTLFTFIGLVWLREQILTGGGPDWLQPINNVAGVRRNRHGDRRIPGQQNNRDNNVIQNNNAGDRGVVDLAGLNDHNWNPAEWDRAAEELTWERLLGLDGSLVFIEHVFWVISLNTLFVIIFAFLPYIIGYYFLLLFEITEYASVTHFEGMVTAFAGYVVISTVLLLLHLLISYTNFTKIRRIVGIAYIVIKVSLLLVIEIGTLPLICGWWLDICSLTAFDITLQDRENSFSVSPSTSMFIHWLVGMVFVYYFASFILILREVLRPGVLWFLRNLNDPDFSPIQEMIHLPMIKHIRRLMASAIIFGVTIMLIVWIPVKILKAVFPTFLPYVITDHSESVNELSLELLLLQVILPALLEQSYVRRWIKGFLCNWCHAISWLLDLKSYILGNELQQQPRLQRLNEGQGEQQNQQQRNRENIMRGLGAAHQALLLRRGGPVGFQPYVKPKYFAIRIGLLLILIALSLITISLAILAIPVYLGRNVMNLWPMLNGNHRGIDHVDDDVRPLRPKIHELYTVSTGTYCCWLLARVISLIVKWIPKGKTVLLKRTWRSITIGCKTAVACFWLLVVIPLLYGFLIELIIVLPLRVPLYQTPVVWTWHVWALGVLYIKISCAIILMGPNWRLRRAVDRAFRNGFTRLNLRHLMKEIVFPVVSMLSLALAIPYVLAYGIVPVFVHSFESRNLIGRRIYPFLASIAIVGLLIVFHVKQFIKLYEHIKNDKYLVGRRLVNYDHR